MSTRLLGTGAGGPRRQCRPLAWLWGAPLLVACGAPPAGDTANSCDVQAAVYTDIDETLTTSNEEWAQQLADPSHDPAMRPDADALMQA